MNRFRIGKMVLGLLILTQMLFVHSAAAHEGHGEPVVADVEIETQHIVPNQEIKLRFKMFNMKAIEEGDQHADEADEYNLAAWVMQGDQVIQIKTTKVNDNEYTGSVTFPKAGDWTLKAHPQKGDEAIDPNDDDPSIFTQTIHVKAASSAVWVWLVVVVAIILVIAAIWVRTRRKKH
ncbi:MAG TPA: hypothetical protein VF260_04685 [Bacilli bacterium]